MGYIGKIKERLSLEVKVAKEYNYSRPAYAYGTEYRTIYIFEDVDGNQFKWDTGSTLGLDRPKRDEERCYYCIKADGSEWVWESIPVGSIIRIKGTVKAHSEYKEVEQTVLNRVVVTEIVEKALTPEQLEEIRRAEEEAKKQAQLDSIGEGDRIWRMPYKQYKEHYSDCETIIGSYECDRTGYKTIKVIIRNGRLKNSGVRGETFQRYSYKAINDGKEITKVYKAICEENAHKRLLKEFPEYDWELDAVYFSRM